MDVIGDRKLRFRVNVRPISPRRSPKNYGSVHDLSAMIAGVLPAANRFFREASNFRQVKS
jgi:hypothetical protein